MQTIVIASQKGGSGKTTIAAHLAVAGELVGGAQTVIVDTDPQQTLATWWEAREAQTPQLAPIAADRLSGERATLETMGFAYCLVDTPPALTEQNRELLALADLVLVPVRPSPTDMWALGATLDLIRQAQTPHVFVMTQAKGNARITVQTMAALSEHGQVFPSILHDRVDFAAAMTDGRTSLEIRPASPAAAETVALWEQVEDRLASAAKSAPRSEPLNHRATAPPTNA